jgi:cobalt/nickel transport system ATP-binding protein
MHAPLISLQRLSYAYPDGTLALHNIFLDIHPQERVALIGANGSGKSTLLQHLNGLLLAQSGSVHVGEWPMHPQHFQAIRNAVGMVFQNPDDQLFMPTVWEDVRFGPMNQGIPEPSLSHQAHVAMIAVGLDPVQYGARQAQHLSGGEKKRVAIAGVLAMRPQVLVLDEPSAQLDPRSRRQLIQVLHQLPLTQLIATHDLDLALELCDRTVILSQGHMVYDGPTETVMRDEKFLLEHALELPLSFTGQRRNPILAARIDC